MSWVARQLTQFIPARIIATMGRCSLMVYSEAYLFDYLRLVCLRAGNRAAAAALRFFPYGKFEIQLKRPERHLWCGLNGSARNAAHYRKQARRSSDTSPEAKTSL
jgi:hypothetical protein